MMITASRLGLVMFLAVLFSAGMAAAQDRRGPFTQPPRSVRSRDFDQQHLRLELAFDWDKRQVRGRAGKPGWRWEDGGVHELASKLQMSTNQGDADQSPRQPGTGK